MKLKSSLKLKMEVIYLSLMEEGLKNTWDDFGADLHGELGQFTWTDGR